MQVIFGINDARLFEFRTRLLVKESSDNVKRPPPPPPPPPKKKQLSCCTASGVVHFENILLKLANNSIVLGFILALF